MHNSKNSHFHDACVSANVILGMLVWHVLAFETVLLTS